MSGMRQCATDGYIAKVNEREREKEREIVERREQIVVQ